MLRTLPTFNLLVAIVDREGECRRWHLPPFSIVINLILSLLVTAIGGVLVYVDGAAALPEEYQAFVDRFSYDPQWLALGHYQPALLYKYKSTADAVDFFLSAGGKTNPKSELVATIEAFLADDQVVEPAQCRFPARYQWLRQRIGLEGKFPQVDCRLFQEWFDEISPHKVTLIFPTAFLNNPASAFGHTLLRIDPDSGDAGRPLLSYAANYAAETHGENALLYALLGIFGGYQGYFSVSPYYQKVRHYSDIENRDIWEYQLRLSKSETELLVRHLWELRQIPFDYYYFDENCSYQLLSLLDVARPSLRLVNVFKSWVIPVDSVRAVLSKNNIFDSAIFRPSAATVLRNRIQNTPQSLHSLARELASNETEQSWQLLAGHEARNQAVILDLAFDAYRYYHYGDGSEEADRRAFKILQMRSKLSPAEPPQVPTPVSRADQGHRTAKMSYGVGHGNDSWFQEWALRPALHDLLDPPVGFTPGASISFFDTRIRQYETEKIKLEQLAPLRVTSLTSHDGFVRPISWQLGLGWKRLQLGQRKRPLHGQLTVGAGVAQESPVGLAYELIDIELRHSSHLDDNYAVGVGPQLGLIGFPSSQLSWKAYGSVKRFGFGEHFSTFSIGTTLAWQLATDLQVRVQFERRDDASQPYNQTSLGLHWYLDPL